MKQRIEEKFTDEELDSFLMKKYKYGIWDFENFFVTIFLIYHEKFTKKMHKFFDKRIDRLEKIKKRLVKIVDVFLIEINFYELDKMISEKPKIWNPQNKENFIIKKFELRRFFSAIDRLVLVLKNMKSRWYEEYETLPKIKPITLIILTLSYVMKAGKKIDWINMEKLLNLFSIKFDKAGIFDFLELEKWNAYSDETLRSIRNRYKNTKYDILAKYFFAFTFATARKFYEEKTPQPLTELKEEIEESFDHELKKKACDFWLGINIKTKLPYKKENSKQKIEDLMNEY